MLELQLEHPASRQTISVGPASHFTVRGNRLLAGADEEEIGFYQDGLWHVEGHSFTSIKPHSPIIIYFQDNATSDPSATLGPFEDAGLVDGAIRHGPRLGRLLAKFEEDTQTWLVIPSQKKFAAAVLRPVEE